MNLSINIRVSQRLVVGISNMASRVARLKILKRLPDNLKRKCHGVVCDRFNKALLQHIRRRASR